MNLDSSIDIWGSCDNGALNLDFFQGTSSASDLFGSINSFDPLDVPSFSFDEPTPAAWGDGSGINAFPPAFTPFNPWPDFALPNAGNTPSLGAFNQPFAAFEPSTSIERGKSYALESKLSDLAGGLGLAVSAFGAAGVFTRPWPPLSLALTGTGVMLGGLSAVTFWAKAKLIENREAFDRKNGP